MPRQNRVLPTGEIVSIPLRGAWLGNRGVLHEGEKIVRPYRNLGWLICLLEFKDWRLPQWAPHRMTLLFFHDEAVALAAGHRPCALCRRASYNDFRTAWAAGQGVAVPAAKELDRQLQHERFSKPGKTGRIHQASWSSLPDGTFVIMNSGPALVREKSYVPWTNTGYGTSLARPTIGNVDVITPRSTVAALRGGYRPQIDPSAS